MLEFILFCVGIGCLGIILNIIELKAWKMVNTEMEKAHRKTQILKPCMLLWQKTLFVLDQWDVDIQSVLQANFVSVHLYVQTHHNKLNSIPKEDIYSAQ